MEVLKVTLLLGVISIFPGKTGCGAEHGTAPYILEQPLDAVVARHQPVTLACRAGGVPTPQVQWFHDNLLVTSHAHVSLLPHGDLFFLRVMHSRTHSDAGVYWCEAFNRYGTARSRNATLTVAVLREEFRLEPTSVDTAEGDSVTLQCQPPRGNPEPHVFWRKDGEMLRLEDDSRVVIQAGGNLRIEAARQGDAGEYQCVAKNAAGTRHSAVATITVHTKPYLITGPEDTILRAGETATFQCVVGGSPIPSLHWRRGGVVLSKAESLRLPRVTVADEGQYECHAKNSVGSLTAQAQLIVYVAPDVAMTPNTARMHRGSKANFTCNVGGKPEPIVFWSIEGNKSIISPGSSTEYYEASPLGSGVTVFKVNETNKTKVTVICSAVNFAGSAIDRGVVIITSDDDIPPPIITHGPSNQTLPLTSNVIFPCLAIGSPPPVIAWYFNGEALIQDHKKYVSGDNALTIKELDNNDSGTYTCVASSQHGKYVSSGILTVSSPIGLNNSFYRAPDDIFLPKPPTKPYFYNRTSNSVTVMWNKTNHIISSSILDYQIEMFSKESLTGNNTARNSRGWTIIAKDVKRTHHIVNTLTSNVKYMFIVRARNSYGLSAPSPVSDYITVTEEPDVDNENFIRHKTNILKDNIVEIIEATPIDSTTVKLIWEIQNFYNLEGLLIYYKQLDSNSTEFHVKTVAHSNDISGYKITALMKYTKYVFFVIPFYDDFEGKPSNSKIAYTLEDAPDGPPQDIELVIINRTTVQLKWASPEPNKQNGMIANYNVIVNYLDLSLNKSEMVVNDTVKQSIRLVVTDLTESGIYSAKVAAATAVGMGPYSETIYFNIETQFVGIVPMWRQLSKGDVVSASGELTMETWLCFLVGTLILFKVVVFMAVVYVRKRKNIAKKTALPNIYDSRGSSLVTQMNMKASLTVAHPLNCCSKDTTVKTESLLWMGNKEMVRKTRSEHLEEGEADPDYDKVAQPPPEYAEVSCGGFGVDKWGVDETPAAYASVTLIANSKQCSGSLDWLPPLEKQSYSQKVPFDEDLYPASNGGYYNRNVNSEKYYRSNGNKMKCFDSPSVDSGSEGQSSRRNSPLVNRKKSESEISPFLFGREENIAYNYSNTKPMKLRSDEFTVTSQQSLLQPKLSLQPFNSFPAR